jgi:hypothetical protein
MTVDRDDFPQAQLWRRWWQLFGLRAPLSGDVVQDIAPAVSSQLGFINIHQTRSKDPDLEQRIITEVASYGRQLGRLMEAVDVLVQRVDRTSLSAEDRDALDDLHELAEEIEALKQRTAVERVDRIVSDVRELAKDPDANRDALRRVRDALRD